MPIKRGAPALDCVLCPSCSWAGELLEMHFNKVPACRPKLEPEKVRDGSKSFNLFRTRLHALIADNFWDGHTSHFIQIAHLEVFRILLISIVVLIIAFVKMEVNSEHATSEGLTLNKVVGLCDRILATFTDIPSARAQVNARQRKWLAVTPLLRNSLSSPSPCADRSRITPPPPADGKKHCITFSILQLLTVMMWESKSIRTKAQESNTLWKSGVLHNVFPEVVEDVTQGRRFRTSDVCRKATALEAMDFRVDLALWNDAFTSVGGLSTKAKENKWEVVLGSLINLPLWMRHYFDHLLLS